MAIIVTHAHLDLQDKLLTLQWQRDQTQVHVSLLPAAVFNGSQFSELTFWVLKTRVRVAKIGKHHIYVSCMELASTSLCSNLLSRMCHAWSTNFIKKNIPSSLPAVACSSGQICVLCVWHKRFKSWLSKSQWGHVWQALSPFKIVMYMWPELNGNRVQSS